MLNPNEDTLERSLERYAEGPEHRGLERHLEMLGDPGTRPFRWRAIPVSNRDEIESFFAQAIESYRSQGLVATRPSSRGP